jgi:alkylation response protein AidB-like acyl-CoA dehydrogenase
MSVLNPAAVAVIREHAAEAEAEGRGELHPAVLELIYEQQWFRSMVPQRFAGLGLPLPAVVRLEEELARADGSVGWTVTLCSGAGWFAGFFGPGELDPLFSHPRLCIAGSGTAAGRAERLAGGGYRVNGQWQYASGARHAMAFTANCVIWADGAPVTGEDGQPLVRPFLFLRKEVQVLDDWRAVGLVATGSHGFVVTELEVPPERCFVIDGSAATDAAPLYRYPFLPLAEATLAINSCGMAWHFLECFAAVFERRKGHLPAAGVKEAGVVFGAAQSELVRVREEFYAALDASWTTAAGPGLFDAVSTTSKTLAATVRFWVDRLYPFAGLGAANTESEINRVWRDLHTASQHPLLAFS